MADAQITCITKQPGHQDPYHGITHLGGSGWRWTKEQVIESIKNKTNTFFTMSNGQRAEVGVVEGPSAPYLRSYANGKWNDNLLSLPTCPG